MDGVEDVLSLPWAWHTHGVASEAARVFHPVHPRSASGRRSHGRSCLRRGHVAAGVAGVAAGVAGVAVGVASVAADVADVAAGVAGVAAGIEGAATGVVCAD